MSITHDGLFRRPEQSDNSVLRSSACGVDIEIRCCLTLQFGAILTM